MNGDQSLEDFKARLPLVEIVARHVRLTRRGREHVGLCPFHNDRKPSFSVVEDKGFYHCFSCGAHGNAIDFIMNIEGLPFPEALQRLADLTGIEPPRRRPAGPAEKKALGLAEANEAAAAFFMEQLATPAGKEARDYLRRRGVGEAAIRRFEIGYAPSSRGVLEQALLRAGFSKDVLIEANLVVRDEDSGETFDRFRHRLMFPIRDTRGRVTGFGGRALAEARAKYLNTSETPLFHKGRLLYGLPLATKAARARRRLLLVEGYMDVVALAEAGIEEVVAPLGTAVTEEQLALLWRHADQPVVCLDGDAPGLGAALRLVRRALGVLEPGKGLRFAVLPEGEDPDTFVRQHGVEAMNRVLEATTPLSSFIWNEESARGDLDTPEQLGDLRKRLRGYTDLVRDPEFKQDLVRHFNEQIDAARQAIYRQRRGPAGGRRREESAPAGGWKSDRSRALASLERADHTNELRLLATFIDWPRLMEVHEEDLHNLDFQNPLADALRQEMLAWYCEATDLDASRLKDHLLRYGFEDVLRTTGCLRADRPSGKTDVDPLVAEELERVLANIRRRAARQLEEEAFEVELRNRRGSEAGGRLLSIDRLLNNEDEIAPPKGLVKSNTTG